MKHIFLSVNEDLDSGLLKSQFLSPIRKHFSYEYEIVSVNRPFYKKNIQGVLSLNILIPQSIIAYNFLCVFYHLWAAFCATILVIQFRHVTHKKVVARGYLSGLIAYYMKKIYGIDYIFDPRSLYPFESVTANRMKKNSFPYKFWLSIERSIVNLSERIVCVSSGMADYYSTRFKTNKTTIVPCYRTEQSGFNSNIDTATIKRKLLLNENRKVVLYYGSLNNGWNNIDLYARYISDSFKDNEQILIVSQDQDRILKSVIGTLDNVKVYSLDSLPEGVAIEDVFHCADYGMIFMAESHDWFTRLSVKFAEYTYFGLPVITNKWVGEAARLITEFPLYPSVILGDEPVHLQNPSVKNKIEISQWARDYFSPSNINKYVGK